MINCKVCGRRWSWPILSHCTRIFLEAMMNTVTSHFTNRDLKPSSRIGFRNVNHCKARFGGHAMNTIISAKKWDALNNEKEIMGLGMNFKREFTVWNVSIHKETHRTQWNLCMLWVSMTQPISMKAQFIFKCWCVSDCWHILISAFFPLQDWDRKVITEVKWEWIAL